jgi:carbonic anhydrase
MMAAQLRSSEPVMAELVQAGKLKVVAAYYELDSGKVTILP